MSNILRSYTSRTSDVSVAVLLAVLPAGLVAFHIGWPSPWQGLSLPLAVAAFGLIWALWMIRRAGTVRLSVIGLGFWIFGIHLAMWLPLLFGSYSHAHGLSNLDFSVWASLVTGAIVAWFVLADHLWVTMIVGLGLVASVAIMRARRFDDMGKQD